MIGFERVTILKLDQKQAWPLPAPFTTFSWYQTMLQSYLLNCFKKITNDWILAPNLSLWNRVHKQILVVVEKCYNLDKPLGIATKIIVQVGIKKILTVIKAEHK